MQLLNTGTQKMTVSRLQVTSVYAIAPLACAYSPPDTYGSLSTIQTWSFHFSSLTYFINYIRKTSIDFRLQLCKYLFQCNFK